jgi:iron(III) transport system ATP-binding protein
MIRIEHLKKKFAVKDSVVAALHGIDLHVDAKEFFVLLGPSGSGKSTLLRCVAGIEVPDEGKIWLDENLIFSGADGVFVRPENRGLGMVFQSYAVWPHMTVYQNIALPLTHGTKRIPKSQVRDRVMSALELVQLEKLADRPVPFLSGGQQQRVALARALAVEPVVMLMDEPLSNLDARLREEVRHQIREVTRAVGVTVLYVTHDQIEALSLGDRVAVMDKGAILQIDRPNNLYQRPQMPIVADFFGQMNWFDARADGSDKIETPFGVIEADLRGMTGSIKFGVRPSNVQLSLGPSSGGVNQVEGRVVEETFLGEVMEIKVRIKGEVIVESRLPRRAHEEWLGQAVTCYFDRNDILIFPRS